MGGLTVSDQAIVAAYAILAAATVVVLRRERATAVPDDHVWPTIWVLTGCFLVFGAVARDVSLVSVVGDVTRSQARDGGWYEHRRRLQVLAVVAVGGWASTVLYSALRTSERRRRYLPIAVAIVTLAAFVTIRSISLHQIDTLLYHPLGPVDTGVIVEWLLLLAVAYGLVAAWRSPRAGT